MLPSIPSLCAILRSSDSGLAFLCKLAVAARFKEQLSKTGHSDMCPWRDQAVPMAMIQACAVVLALAMMHVCVSTQKKGISPLALPPLRGCYCYPARLLLLSLLYALHYHTAYEFQ